MIRWEIKHYDREHLTRRLDVLVAIGLYDKEDCIWLFRNVNIAIRTSEEYLFLLERGSMDGYYV